MRKKLLATLFFITLSIFFTACSAETKESLQHEKEAVEQEIQTLIIECLQGKYSEEECQNRAQQLSKRQKEINKQLLSK